MEKYWQPTFYKFNRDSIDLVDFVVAYCFQKNFFPAQVLDLCAGCGIIGLEFHRKIKRPVEKLVFIERNDAFRESLIQNQQAFASSEVEIENFLAPFQDYTQTQKFDLILSNPPYYNRERFRVSEEKHRAVARSFEPGFIELFVDFLTERLNSGGMAFFVFHESSQAPFLSYPNIKIEKRISAEVILFSLFSSE